jgi:hypothetical protein
LREVLALSPLLVFILWIGLQPRFFLDRMAPTLDRLMAPVRSIEQAADECREEFVVLSNAKPKSHVLRNIDRNECHDYCGEHEAEQAEQTEATDEHR